MRGAKGGCGQNLAAGRHRHIALCARRAGGLWPIADRGSRIAGGRASPGRLPPALGRRVRRFAAGGAVLPRNPARLVAEDAKRLRRVELLRRRSVTLGGVAAVGRPWFDSAIGCRSSQNSISHAPSR